MDPTALDMAMVQAPRGPVPMEEDVDIHEPFTSEERFRQLKDIDYDITSLLEHTRRAVAALTKPPIHPDAPAMNGSSLSQTQPPPTQAEAPTPTQPPLGVANPAPVAAGPDAFDPQAQFADFKTAMYDFIAAVDSVDKRLKRQLYGLEEAGIIKLRGPAGAPGGMGADPVSSLEPDGAGKIGELDVGQLNAGSSTVERDMERELWETATGHLLRVVGRNFETSGDAMALE